MSETMLKTKTVIAIVALSIHFVKFYDKVIVKTLK